MGRRVPFKMCQHSPGIRSSRDVLPTVFGMTPVVVQERKYSSPVTQFRRFDVRSSWSKSIPVRGVFGVSVFLSLAIDANAQETNTFREPPRGAGTPTGDARVGNDDRVHEGAQLAVLVGVGYGLGVGARAGFAFRPGVYAGGAVTYYTGNAMFVGGELGYKFFVK